MMPRGSGSASYECSGDGVVRSDEGEEEGEGEGEGEGVSMMQGRQYDIEDRGRGPDAPRDNLQHAEHAAT